MFSPCFYAYFLHYSRFFFVLQFVQKISRVFRKKLLTYKGFYDNMTLPVKKGFLFLRPFFKLRDAM